MTTDELRQAVEDLLRWAWPIIGVSEIMHACCGHEIRSKYWHIILYSDDKNPDFKEGVKVFGPVHLKRLHEQLLVARLTK